MGHDPDHELGLVRRSGGQVTGKLTSLQVVGLSMKPLEVATDEAPSRPLSRASRAESMGSLADYSAQSLQPSPADYQQRVRQVGWPPVSSLSYRPCLQTPDNLRAGRSDRRSVGGGGTLLGARSHLSSHPPLLSLSPYSQLQNNGYRRVAISHPLGRDTFCLF